MKWIKKFIWQRKKQEHEIPEGFHNLEDFLKKAEMEKDDKGYKCALTFAKNEAMQIILNEIANYFYECKCENYISMKFFDPRTDQQFEFTIQKCDGKTPTEKLAELEKKYSGLLNAYNEMVFKRDTK